MWGRGGGAHQLQCKSESPQCSEKQQSPCEGEGGLKFEKKMLEKLGIGSPAFFTFHSPQPNNIGPAWQQPRALFLISLCLVGEGRGHSYCI